MGSIETDHCRNIVFDPSSYPPFPEDTKPLVDLATFRYTDIVSDNDPEAKRLFDVSCKQGFFYLDFADSDMAELPSEAEKVGRLAERVFQSSDEEKYRCAYGRHNRHIFGYKRAGLTKTDAKGTADTAELFNLSKDVLLETPTRDVTIDDSLPEVARGASERSLLAKYAMSCHDVGLRVLEVINSELGLDRNTLLDLHNVNIPAGDMIRVTYGPPRKSDNPVSDPEIQTPGHTDFGSITVLFNWLGGLQVWHDPTDSRQNFTNCVDDTTGGGQWLWVKPKPDCAIINLGDSMVKFTGGVLKSGRHRVVPAPGAQGKFSRFSVVYFVRPENGVKMDRLVGGCIPKKTAEEEQEEVFTAGEWSVRQANRMREGVKREENVVDV